MAPLIETRGLRVGFRGASGAMLPVLRDIDLRVERGESLGIVGESGSGKSTLALAAMAGTTIPALLTDPTEYWLIGLIAYLFIMGAYYLCKPLSKVRHGQA